MENVLTALRELLECAHPEEKRKRSSDYGTVASGNELEICTACGSRHTVMRGTTRHSVWTRPDLLTAILDRQIADSFLEREIAKSLETRANLALCAPVLAAARVAYDTRLTRSVAELAAEEISLSMRERLLRKWTSGENCIAVCDIHYARDAAELIVREGQRGVVTNVSDAGVLSIMWEGQEPRTLATSPDSVDAIKGET